MSNLVMAGISLHTAVKLLRMNHGHQLAENGLSCVHPPSIKAEPIVRTVMRATSNRSQPHFEPTSLPLGCYNAYCAKQPDSSEMKEIFHGKR